MTNLLNMFMFFEDATTATDGTATNQSWTTWVFLGVVVVMMVLLMVIPQRRNKKKAEEMMNKLKVGATVTTIGGIIGEVIEMNPANGHIFVLTGVGDNKTTMEFTKGAIYMVQSEQEAAKEVSQAKSKNEEEVDEIK